MVIVRFAPSPTGFLHIGGARTALFNWLFAKKNNGKFLLRIEDTDHNRSEKKYVDSIIEALDWLKITSDEPIVYQSQNYDKHRMFAYKLLEKDLAYWCSCPQESEREQTVKQKHRHKCKGAGENQVLRIKTPEKGFVEFNDLVFGKISVNLSEINDFIILRSNNNPVYQFCAPIDDHMMDITHVIRGNDHVNNTFAQILIYKFLDLQQPQFAHIPLIHNINGEKLSKRRDAVDTIKYKDMGILPEALKNYLLSLGFSYNEQEIFTEKESIDCFDLKHINHSPARFDMNKLLHINHYYIKNSTSEDLLKEIEKIYLQTNNKHLEENHKDRILKGMQGLKERSNTTNDIINNAWFYLNEEITPSDEDIKKFLNKDVLLKITELLKNLEKWNIDSLKEFFANLGQKNIASKPSMQSLRIVLTGTMQSPSIIEIMNALGKEECIKRIEKFTS